MAQQDADFSSGLPVAKESVVKTPPTEPFWTENLLFALYDPKSDLGFWLHLGTMPNDWTMWEDRVFAWLPGNEGVLSMWAYHRTPPEKQPGGSNLFFKCIEPFKRWRVTFDGYGLHTTNEEMTAGLAPDGLRKKLWLDLEITAAMPVWDAHMAAKSKSGKGGMENQSWAKEHYEQMYNARGTVRVDDKEYPFDGTGWRDHSRGPRGGDTADPWGGHVITGALFPSGRAYIFSSYWKPDGTINLEGGCVVDKDGKFHFAEVLDPPRMPTLEMSGEKLPVHLRWPGGELKTHMLTTRSYWLSMQKRLAVGKDMSGNALMYVLNFGPVEWDGETGYAYIERSDPLKAFPKKLKAPER